MGNSNDYVTPNRLKITSYGMVSVTSIFVLSRLLLRLRTHGRLQLEDFAVLLSYGLFLAMSIMYIIISPTLFLMQDIEVGNTASTPDFENSLDITLRMLFANTMLFWISLWTVKASLLVLYKRLMAGHATQLKCWWAVAVFCILSLIGAIVSEMIACTPVKSWFTPGACNSVRDTKIRLIVYYYAFAVDVVTDILLMVLPLRLLSQLQMPRSQKFTTVIIFLVGIVCISMAAIRVSQIGVEGGGSKAPTITWLVFWTIVESSVAVILGCLPTFAASYRTARASYRNTFGFGDSGPYTGAFRLNGIITKGVSKHGSQILGGTKADRKNIIAVWSTTRASVGSEVQLNQKSGEIYVTRTIRQSDHSS